MICKECSNKMVRDHVTEEIDYFVCLNKNCKEYGNVKSNSGLTEAMEIKQPKANIGN